MGGHVPPGIGKMVADAARATGLVNFVCVNVGPRYEMRYVEILRDMVLRNASTLERDCAFWCITDRPDELPEGVYPIASKGVAGWWAKMQLFAPDLPFRLGDRCVYFDLDVAITGRLEDLVERKGIVQDYGWPCYNSSVMVWDHGEHREAWDRLCPEIMTRSPGPIVPAGVLPAGQPNGGDQEWLTELGGWETFPRDWCLSYRWQVKGWPPNECKVVIFHGEPKPHEVTEGWVPNIWKVGGFTSIPAVKGVNTTLDERMANVRSAVQRDLPWFTGYKPHKRLAVIVGGGPSVRDCLPEIRAKKRAGAQIISVNNAWRFLVQHGITPDRHVMLDARPDNAEFVRGAPKSMRFVLASQCHPDVFDALADHEVVIWHNGFGDNSEVMEILKPWWDPGPNQRPCILIPGGSTVGLRALWLAHESGFRKIHVYGLDGSYAADGSHHAYSQKLNDGEDVVEAVMGEKRYRCARWMLRQAEEFRVTWNDLRAVGTRVFVHGTGLVPDICKMLRDEERFG